MKLLLLAGLCVGLMCGCRSKKDAAAPSTPADACTARKQLRAQVAAFKPPPKIMFTDDDYRSVWIYLDQQPRKFIGTPRAGANQFRRLESLVADPTDRFVVGETFDVVMSLTTMHTRTVKCAIEEFALVEQRDCPPLPMARTDCLAPRPELRGEKSVVRAIAALASQRPLRAVEMTEGPVPEPAVLKRLATKWLSSEEQADPEWLVTGTPHSDGSRRFIVADVYKRLAGTVDHIGKPYKGTLTLIADPADADGWRVVGELSTSGARPVSWGDEVIFYDWNDSSPVVRRASGELINAAVGLDCGSGC